MIVSLQVDPDLWRDVERNLLDGWPNTPVCPGHLPDGCFFIFQCVFHFLDSCMMLYVVLSCLLLEDVAFN